ncbi:MAG: 50S ribosomal protein L4 [candidate division Zixibacteria bacterium]|nr:50S ribosomal protein L4 [candidate division Zixibacteria bacterium]
MNVKVYNQDGKEVGVVELKPQLFEVEPHEALVHQYIVNYLARQRQGNASTKGRSEVRGGGRKPWRQKGTGRARAGTIRSPLWNGGGITFGPKPRKYGYVMPRKMKRRAIQSTLSDKARSEKFMVVDRVDLEQIKTSAMASILTKLDLEEKKCLLLDEGKNDNVVLSCRNLPRIKYCRATLTNGYDVLNAEYVVCTKAGLDKLHEVFG